MQKLVRMGQGLSGQLSPLDSIFGQQFSPARTAPSPDPESIDWLLLMPKVGTIPTGIFADVDYIQRIATKGGKAPLTPPTSLSETVEVKYKTVYRFTKINPNQIEKLNKPLIIKPYQMTTTSFKMNRWSIASLFLTTVVTAIVLISCQKGAEPE